LKEKLKDGFLLPKGFSFLKEGIIIKKKEKICERKNT